MMLPPPPAIIRRPAAWAQMKTPVRFTPTTWSHASCVISSDERDGLDAGVVHADVEPAMVGHDARHDPVDLGPVGDVERHAPTRARDARAPTTVASAVGRSRSAITTVAPCSRKRVDDRPADAAGAAGDDRHPSREVGARADALDRWRRHGRRPPAPAVTTSRSAVVGLGRGGERQQRLLVRLASLHLRDDPTVPKDEVAVARADELGRLGARDEDRAATLTRQGPQLAVDLVTGTDIDAARRLVEQEHAGVAHEPAREQRLLLVAAREARDRLPR